MLLLIASLLAGVQATTAPASSPSPSTEAKAFDEGCAGRKFETAIAREVNGKRRLSRIHLCGNPGQTDAQWVRTLEDAIAKIEASSGFSADSKTQAIEAIKDEIAKAGGKTGAIGSGNVTAILGDPATPAAPVEYTKLPPLPSSRSSVAATPGPPVEYTKLPPLPEAKAAATRAVAAAQLMLARPQLTIRCFNPAEFAAPAECESLERETVLTVKADEAVPAWTSLRFLRRGDNRAEVELAQLGRGKSERFGLPREVCAGVVESKVEIQIVRRASSQGAGQVVDSLGPYMLRC